MKVLLAEDDPRLASKLVRLLRSEGCSVDLADNGLDALHLGETGHYDAVTLDLNLPELGGREVLAAWRSGGREFPVLILTVRDSWTDKAALFGSGADDYLTKPFLAQELIVRLRALARRSRGLKSEPITCGKLAYHPLTGSFEFDGAILKLTAYEGRILEKLIQFKEMTVEREKLFDYLYDWASLEIPFNSFEVLISRLRRKIGHAMIETVRGQGYRLTAGQ